MAFSRDGREPHPRRQLTLDELVRISEASHAAVERARADVRRIEALIRAERALWVAWYDRRGERHQRTAGAEFPDRHAERN